MKALKTLLLVLGAFIAVVLILGLVAPKEMSMERSIVIDASKAAIFPHIRYFEKRSAWYPWTKKDPNMKSEVVGPDGATGTVYKWEGNDEVGIGEQELGPIQDPDRIETTLRFKVPFEAEAATYMNLDEVENGTKVSWGFSGSTPFPFNIMNLLMSMENSVGKDYDEGLQALKDVVENQNTSLNMYEIKSVALPIQHFVGIREQVDISKISEHYQKNLPKVYQKLTEEKVAMAGNPCGLFFHYDEETGITDVAQVIPVKEPVEVEGFETFSIGTDKTLLVDYYGGYHGTGTAHEALQKHVDENQLKLDNPVIEQYVTDPGTEPDSSKWLTKIYYPLAQG